MPYHRIGQPKILIIAVTIKKETTGTIATYTGLICSVVYYKVWIA